MASFSNSHSQEKEGILCSDNCGFFGSSETMNFCSACYKIHLKNNAKAEEDGSSSTNADILKGNERKRSRDTCSAVTEEEGEKGNDANKVRPNRCSSCKKRVGLTGFHCRCGDLFCGLHRYADEHNCPFDYRKTAQQSIANSNSLIRPEKFQKLGFLHRFTFLFVLPIFYGPLPVFRAHKVWPWQ